MPKQVVELIATATPAVERSLRFALLGDSLDASLDQSEVVTDSATGSAAVLLSAPSMPASFAVRVTTTGADPFVLPVAVPMTGVATLDVWASYDGERSLMTEHMASAWENKTCADLEGAPPDDGQVAASSPYFPVELEVRTGVPLAVILRAARFTWGCATVDAAQEGARIAIEVPLTDVPIKLDQSDVRLTLAVDPATPLTETLDTVSADVLAALDGGASDDSAALLDAMQGTLDDDAPFQAARKAGQWDDYLRSTLPDGGASLRTALGGWLTDGVHGLNFGELVVGQLKGASGSAAPHFTVESVLGLSPDLSSFELAGKPTWSAEPDDSVLVGLQLRFDPVGLVLGAATAPALAAETHAGGVGEALADSFCDTVATVLVARGEAAKQSLIGCDLACTVELCGAGMAALLDAASAPAKEPATLEIAVTGSGGVGDDANLTSLSGSWIGKLAVPDPTASGSDTPNVALGGLATAVDFKN
jgi:hypothetical protein